MAKETKAPKYVYSFGGGKADGNESMKNLLGGKGANLAEMAGHPNLMLPVPPGYTPPKYVPPFTTIKRTILLNFKVKQKKL